MPKRSTPQAKQARTGITSATAREKKDDDDKVRNRDNKANKPRLVAQKTAVASVGAVDKQQHQKQQQQQQQQQKDEGDRAVAAQEEENKDDSTMMRQFLSRQPLWVFLAVASGMCAAFNGVFAKLTTTALTSTLVTHIASLFSIVPESTGAKALEFVVRGTFFGLNLLFNVAMWALFTAALTRAASTTRVSIVNVSANFFVTALLGWLIFSERLPGLWWVGAAMLAAGNVVIGRRSEEGEKKLGGEDIAGESVGLLGVVEDEEEGRSLTHRHEDIELLGGEVDDDEEGKDIRRVRRGEEVDDPI